MAIETPTETDLPTIAFESFGVALSVSAPSDELLSRVAQVLPPGWRATTAPLEANQHFALVSPDGISYWVQNQLGVFAGGSDVDVALDVLDSTLRSYIAVRAPDRIFVHAGVVAHRGRAIVIPGVSFSGKTSLVAELVSRGATYYSDEYAVLDAEGRVHPYAKPLSVRNGGLSQRDQPVEDFGGQAGTGAVPVGLVVLASYRPGAAWAPEVMSPGEAALAVLANTLPAQDRPAESMTAIRRLLDNAVVLEGERGEAAQVAPDLLARLDG